MHKRSKRVLSGIPVGLFVALALIGQACFAGGPIEKEVSNARVPAKDYLDVSLGVASIYQQNTRGGLATKK